MDPSWDMGSRRVAYEISGWHGGFLHPGGSLEDPHPGLSGFLPLNVGSRPSITTRNRNPRKDQHVFLCTVVR